jgi:hypothetical protein
VRFLLGTHLEQWLWDESTGVGPALREAGVGLFVSHSRLRHRKSRFPAATVPWWGLDSMGFSMLKLNGRWTVSPREYAQAVLRYDREIGRLEWAAPQDHMCERWIIEGGVHDGQAYAGTRQFIDPAGRMTYEQLVTEHQLRSVANFRELEQAWGEFRRLGEAGRGSPFRPALQGKPGDPESYLDCAQMYEDAGVRLSDYPVVGVGSVCRIQADPVIERMARGLDELKLQLHWFGLKLTGIPKVWPNVFSSDSQSWGTWARRDPRMEGCTHVRVRGKYVGQPSTCANCPRYALRWLGKVVSLIASLESRDLEAVSE